jgi:hypothetical protein
MSSSWSLLSFVDSSWLLKAIVLACAAIAGIWVLRKNSERVFSTAEKDEPDLRCPLDSASLVERLSFRWVTPLLTVCRERSITDNDLWELKDEVL